MGPRISKTISERIAESDAWDFKQTLYDQSDRGTADFLKDVTAFANASGGTIVLGVRTDDAGRADAVMGISPTNGIDAEIQRLEHILRDSVAPDITGAVKISEESDATGKQVLIIDIEESSLAPHRIVAKGKYKSHFFIRRGRRCEEADVAALRDMFAGKQRAGDMFRSFVRTRVEAIKIGDYPHGQEAVPEMLVHVAPRRSFGSRRLVDWLLLPDNRFRFVPNTQTAFRSRPNIYGVISIGDQIGSPYNLAFNNGAAELLRQAFLANPTDTKSGVDASTLARILLDDLPHALRLMHGVFAEDAYFVAINFLRVPKVDLVEHRAAGLARFHNSIPAATQFEIPTSVIRTGSEEAFREDVQYLLDMVWRAWGQERFHGQLNLSWTP